jgi:hypothetical protein
MARRKTAGETLVAALVAEMSANDVEPDSKDDALLEGARRLRDRLEELQDAITVDGTMLESPSGIRRMNPCVAEARQHELALAAVLARLQLTVEAPINRSKQKAAQARWAAKKRTERTA